jgi:hypothetical protein
MCKLGSAPLEHSLLAKDTRQSPPSGWKCFDIIQKKNTRHNQFGVTVLGELRRIRKFDKKV